MEKTNKQTDRKQALYNLLSEQIQLAFRQIPHVTFSVKQRNCINFILQLSYKGRSTYSYLCSIHFSYLQISIIHRSLIIESIQLQRKVGTISATEKV